MKTKNNKKRSKLFIGTSGWVYSHWEGIFYPQNLPAKDYNPPATLQTHPTHPKKETPATFLQYYSKHYNTVEINYSFYHLPRPETFQKWYSRTPGDFIFAVKASRFITHIKRLKGVYPHTKRGQGAKGAKIDKASPRYGVGVKESWKQFIKNALNLKEKLGPILFQFPPSFRATSENLKRLEEFLKLTCLICQIKHLRYAFEFRHKSWCDPEGKPSASYGVNKKIYKLLKKYNAAWVIADSPRYPRADEVTADFVYIRLHGSKILFSSKYTKKELKDLAQKIKKWLKQKLDVYIYFNNDAYGHAVENAKELLRFCET